MSTVCSFCICSTSISEEAFPLPDFVRTVLWSLTGII
nr:MAG TPA: hypothetical protein [Caudoviricetes sp.]